jgi:hypothetical protein
MKRREATLTIALTLALVVGIVLIELPSQPPSNGPPANIVVTSPSLNGLAVTLSLNSTTIQSGKGILITADETNTHSTVNNVTIPIQISVLEGASPCDNYNYSVRVEIIQGNYVTTNYNYTTGRSLQLQKPIAYTCSNIPLDRITGYLFQPLSDTAMRVGDCHGLSCGDWKMSLTTPANGYWTGDISRGVSFQTFPPGVYTVVAEDSWGTVALLHFTVM